MSSFAPLAGPSVALGACRRRKIISNLSDAVTTLCGIADPGCLVPIPVRSAHSDSLIPGLGSRTLPPQDGWILLNLTILTEYGGAVSLTGSDTFEAFLKAI